MTPTKIKIEETPKFDVTKVKDAIRLSVAAGLRGMSTRRMQELCNCGFFKTAHQKGSGPTSPWYVSRAEVTVAEVKGF